MAFYGLSCPNCQTQPLVRKRRSMIRYKELLSDTGLRIGEFRYYCITCSHCHHYYYLQEKFFYQTQEGQFTVKTLVSENAYQNATLFRPGTERIGTTASEYTRRISIGADFRL